MWANLEARIKLANFRLFKQNWYVATNPFMDMGVITKARAFDRQKGDNAAQELINKGLGLYSGEGYDGVHTSVGAGIKLVMNHNFIISVEYGMPLDKRDGKGGLNIGTNYIF